MFRVKTGGNLNVQVGSGAISGTTVITDGLWHHVAVVLDSDGTPDNDEVKLYLDGTEETYSSTTSQPIDTILGDNVTIGVAYSGGSPVVPFTGKIDDVRIYDRALTAIEIAALDAMGD